MPRTVPGTLATIMAQPKRDFDWTIDITLPATAFHFATSPLFSVNGNNYTIDLETVSQIRQTLEAPTDNVTVAIQNKDLVLGQHVVANVDAWHQANAVIGRNYYQISDTTGQRTGVSAWLEMFRGAVQQPVADDSTQLVTFDLIPDTTSPGLIVCSRTEGPLCPFLYKQLGTCNYSGGIATCDHTLTGLNGCDVHANSQHFGGFEHRYNPDGSAPGSGGNDPGPIDPVDPSDPTKPCPRLDQWVRVRGCDGEATAIRVRELTLDDWLWDPIDGQFHPLDTLIVIPKVPIWELVSLNEAVEYTSISHHTMPNAYHATGIQVDQLTRGDRVLTEIDGWLVPSRLTASRLNGDRADTMFIKMKSGHRYCVGNTPHKMFVAHNAVKIGPVPQ